MVYLIVISITVLFLIMTTESVEEIEEALNNVTDAVFFDTERTTTVYHSRHKMDSPWDDATWILACSFIIFTMQSGKLC